MSSRCQGMSGDRRGATLTGESALLAVVVVWIGITAIGWVVDLAHRGFVITLVVAALFTVTKLARKS